MNMLVPSQPHACNICQSKLLFNNRDSWEEITEPWSTTGHDWGYWFDLWCGEAVELAQHGCELMEWLVTLRRPDTTADSQLRAYYTHVSEEQLALDWVEEISQYTDNKDFGRKLVLCAEAEYVSSGIRLGLYTNNGAQRRGCSGHQTKAAELDSIVQ
jgi:hypothetical protein